jgi:hypothetical protein
MPNLWICAFDTHYPAIHKPTFDAMMDFITRNQEKIAGFYFGGDQLDNAEISHFNSNKPLYKPVGSYEKNTRDFDNKVLKPVEDILPEDAERIWQLGNHDDWENQLVAEKPELQGTLERVKLLDLEERGWTVIPCGGSYKLGKLTMIHGETLTGIGNQAPQAHARKAVEVYAGNILFGHVHSPQTFTKILPHHKGDRWQGTCAPVLCTVNPQYIRNRPVAWLNGFVIVETLPGGAFNLYSVIVTNGKFSFAGEVYGGKK